MNTEIQGCIVCGLNVAHQFASIFGSSTIKGTCTHTSKNFTTLLFTNSFPKCIWSIIITILLTINALLIWYDLYLLFEEKSRTTILFQISITVYVVSAICSSLCSSIQGPQRAQELNGLLEMSKSQKYYGISVLFSKHDEKHMKWFLRFSEVILIATFVLITSTKVFYREQSYQSYPGLKSFLFLVAIGVIACDEFDYVITLWIYSRMYEKITVHIKQILNKHLTVENKTLSIVHFLNQVSPVSNRTDSSAIPLHKKLQLARRLYLAITHNVRDTNANYDPVKLIYHLSTGIILIINIFTIINEYQNDNIVYSYPASVALAGCLMILSWGWWYADCLIMKASEIRSYLYLYPISKLDTLSAREVEMILETIAIRVPIITASGLYQISTRLLASMSGMIVMYVLVVMQFQIQLE